MPRLQISVSAEGLRGSSWWAKSKPYAVLRITGGPWNGTELGQTEVILHARDAHWTKIFFLDHYTDASMYIPLTVSIYQHSKRNDRSQHQLLAESNFEVTQVLQCPAHTVRDEVDNGIKITVRIIESIQGPIPRGRLLLHLRGLDIQNVERGVLGLGRSDPYFEICKKNADPSVGVVHWIVVYRSEFILDHSNPFWEPAVIGLEELCHGNVDWPLLIVVRDWNFNGKNRIIGQVETTVQELQRRVAIKGNADRDQAFELFDEQQTEGTGLLCVLQADVQVETLSS